MPAKFTAPRIPLCRQLRILVAAAVISAVAALPASAAKLHVVLIGDPRETGIGLYVAADLLGMSATFTASVREQDLNLVQVDGFERPAPDEAGILNAIRNLPVRPDDAVLVYFSGHGEFTSGAGHLIKIRRGTLSRSRLRAAMSRHSCRLQMLVTDACSLQKPVPPEEFAGAPAGPPETLPLFRNLFFRSSGMLDINACRPGEVAMTHHNPIEGSLFTSAFTALLHEHRENSSYGWTRFISELREGTNTLFQNFIGEVQIGSKPDRRQRTQYPMLFASTVTGPYGLSAASVATNARLGVDVHRQGGRIVVLAAHELGNARRLKLDGVNYGLDPGDVIDAVNGEAIRTLEDLDAAMQKSPQEATIRVINVSDGSALEFSVVLESPGSAKP